VYNSIAISLLKDAGVRLKCIDIGSAGGFHPRMEAIREYADMIGVDADPQECARLNAAAGKNCGRYINAAVGRENEKVELILRKKRQTSSCYKTDMERVRHFHDADRFTQEGALSFTTRSLDSVCRSEKIDGIDYLKIDVEGSELAVLDGYSGSFLLAEIEVNFHPLRKDIPLFDEIMNHMRKRGYLLIDLRRIFWNPLRQKDLGNYPAKGLLMHGDALFALDPFKEANHVFLNTAAARARYLSLLCVYGYLAEALMVIDVLLKARLMSADEAKRSEEIIRRGAVPRKWRPRLARFLLSLEKWVRIPNVLKSGLLMYNYYQYDYHQGDGEPGNHD
jgi:FkbM family methyltransferase